MSPDYNSVLSRDDIEYGLVWGSDTVVLIKTGKGGTICGYQNKYINLAWEIRHSFGYTVVCASNPVDKSGDAIGSAIDVIREHLSRDVPADCEILYVGHSDGALQGARYGWKYPQIKKMLLTNCPLMINWHKTKEGILKLSEKEVLFVYGSLDPSAGLIPFLSQLENDRLHVTVIEGEDHRFSKGIADYAGIVVKCMG